MLALGVGSMLLGELMKMFGENIPQGVVRELMEGVMDGLISHFEIEIDELKRENTKLQEKIEELEPFKERYDEAMELLNKKKKKK